MTACSPASTAVAGMPRLVDAGVAAYRVLLRTWTMAELQTHFLVGMDDEGVDELGETVWAGCLMHDEWMLRQGCFDDLSEIIAAHRADGNAIGVRYYQNMERVAAQRAADLADAVQEAACPR